MPLSHEKMKKLQKGKTCQLKHSEIQDIAASVKLSNANKRKLERAYRNNKGIRIQLSADEIDDNMQGSGFMSSVKKGASQGAKFVKNNKQLNNLKNQAIDKGLNYAVNKAGLSDEVGDVVKGLSKSAINHGFNQVADGAGFMNVARKAAKYGKQGLKIANKVSNALGYDDVDNMLIDGVLSHTVGQVSPELADFASKKINRAVDKHLEGGLIGSVSRMPEPDVSLGPRPTGMGGAQRKRLEEEARAAQMGGSFRKMGEGVNPYLPHTYGGSIGFNPSRANQPQKMTGQDVSPDIELRNRILKHVQIRDDLYFI